jgi:hypothetical protein
VNGGALDLNQAKSLSAPPLISGFDVGDLINLTYTSQGGSVVNFDIDDIGPNGATFISPTNPPSGTVVSYTARPGANVLSQVTGGVGAFIIIGSCNPINGPSGSSPSNSQLLEQARLTLSRIAAAASSQAMGDSVAGAIGDAFSDGGTTQFNEGRIRTSFAAIEAAQVANPNDTRSSAEKKRDDAEKAFASALGYDKMPVKAGPLVARSPWHAWFEGRYTGFDGSNSTSDAHTANLTGGLSYRFTRDFLAGLVAGYEDFRYTMGSTAIFLKGDGFHTGAYFGWRFVDRLRLDGMATYGRIHYDAGANGVTGGFDADRFTGMTKLSGRYGIGGTFYVEPSASMIVAREWQDTFADSAGVAHSTFGFTVGRASVGGEVGTPIPFRSFVLTPFAGVFGDYRFGDQTAAAVSTVPVFDNGWSARVTGGLRSVATNGLSASIGGEYGGLGDPVRFYRLTGRVGVSF